MNVKTRFHFKSNAIIKALDAGVTIFFLFEVIDFFVVSNSK